MGLALVVQLVECPLWGTGGHGFDPGPCDIPKSLKNGTNHFLLGTQTYRVELGLVNQGSG